MHVKPENGLGAGMRHFGDYVLMGEIAAGGMGVIYDARKVSLNKRVALKLIRSGAMASSTEVARFHTEAEAAARLDHPHIVPIYEIGHHEGQHFVSMKLIEGVSLAEQIAAGLWSCASSPPRPIQRAIAALVAKIARAVHHAHQRGVLHRDLKPANILIDAQGEPYLTDFGLAKLVERESGQTQSCAILGTPAYMAPEQAAGNPRQITTATDIYSLGAILYELLAGQPPFSGSSISETLQQVREQEPAPVRKRNPRAHPDLETVCLKCLEKSPDRRYPSAEAVAEELERWLCGEPVLARPVSAGARLVKWVRRHPVTAALSSAVIASVLLGLGGITWQWRRAEAQRAQTEAANMLLRLQRAEDHFASDRADLALATLARLLRDQPENRLAAERLVNALRLRRFLLPAQPRAGTASAPDDAMRVHGDWQATGILSTGILVSNQASGRVVIFTNAHEKIIRDLDLTPEGNWLVSASVDGTAKLWDVRQQRLHLILPHVAAVHSAGLSPDGARVVTATADGTARIWQRSTGTILGSPMHHQRAINSARFNADGTLVVTASDDGAVRVWRGDSGEPESEPLRFGQPVTSARFDSANGHLDIRLDNGERRRFWLSRPQPLLEDPAPPDPPAFWSHREDTNGVWVAWRDRLATNHTQEITFLDLSPDGTRIASASVDKTARIWQPQTLQPLVEPLLHEETVNCACFSPDGRRLATSTSGQKVRLWDAATGQPLSDWIRSRDPVAWVQFAADNRWISTYAQWRWPLHIAEPVAPAWLPELAEAVAGLRLKPGHSPEPVPAAEFFRITATQSGTGSTPPFPAWVHEFLSDEPPRPAK